MKTLLEKAKDISVGRTIRRVTHEEIEIYFALIKGEITARQANSVLFADKSPQVGYGMLHSRFFVVFREAYKMGKVKI